jgi:hypothetical protein
MDTEETKKILKQTLRLYVAESMIYGGPDRYFPNREFVIWSSQRNLGRINKKRESLYSDLKEFNIFDSHILEYALNDMTQQLEIKTYTFNPVQFRNGNMANAVTVVVKGIRAWNYPI